MTDGETSEGADPDPIGLDAPGAARRSFHITKERSGRRVDLFLRQQIKGLSRTRVQQLIGYGGITVNGRIPKASTRLHANDAVEVILPPPAVREVRPEPIPIHVLHEDADLLAINKQADLLVHPGKGHADGTLVNGLAHYFAERGEGIAGVGGDETRPGIVHRLDRHTTGVMVVAKRDETHWHIARQFEDREPLKVYLALVHGQPEGPGGAIEEPLGEHPTVREAFAVRRGDPRARHATTLYRVRERYAGYALVELELKTGRTHQIRVHLTQLGHPIVGDLLYGGEPVGPDEIANPPQPAGAAPMQNYARSKGEVDRLTAAAAPAQLARPALHAAFLRLTHPRSGEPIAFQAPLHEPFAGVVRALRERPAPGPVAGPGEAWIDLDQMA